MPRTYFSAAVFTLFFLFSAVSLACGQDLLSSLTVINKGGENQVNWVFSESYNQSVKSIGIQRSQDSATYYATIGQAAAPTRNQNHYVDGSPVAGSNFYRLFILFKDGSYAFSRPTKIILLPATLSNSGRHPVSFQPSIFVYTNADDNVNISIADAEKNNYTIRFYDAADRFLFEVNDIKKPLLIVDKANFLHSGWFHYELYKNGKIFEKWKFFIAGDRP